MIKNNKLYNKGDIKREIETKITNFGEWVEGVGVMDPCVICPYCRYVKTIFYDTTQEEINKCRKCGKELVKD